MKSGNCLPSWDKHIPDDILKTIFQKLCIGDRFRMKVICKSWKRVLTHDHHVISQALEAPWEILSDDSYSNPEPFLTEIRFESLSEQDRIYRFKLPEGLDCDGRFWYCGSSRGWLVIATGINLNPDMWLWNPLSGLTRKLPPLNTLAVFQGYAAPLLLGYIKSVSTFIERVEVFSMGSVECVVAMLCHDYFQGPIQIAVCSPQENEWIVFGSGGEQIFYSDMLFHNKHGLLYGLAIDDSPDERRPRILLDKLYLTGSGCEINLSTVFVNKIDDTEVMRTEYPFGFSVVERPTHVLRFVEDATGNLLILIVGLDCMIRVSPPGNSGVKSFRCHQTTQLSVQLAGSKPSLDVLTSIGNQAIFLGANGSFAVPCPAHGAEADFIYFAVDHAKGLVDNKYYIVREHGVFSMKRNVLRRTSFKNVMYPLGSKIGWFAAKL